MLWYFGIFCRSLVYLRWVHCLALLFESSSALYTDACNSQGRGRKDNSGKRHGLFIDGCTLFNCYAADFLGVPWPRQSVPCCDDCWRVNGSWTSSASSAMIYRIHAQIPVKPWWGCHQGPNPTFPSKWPTHARTHPLCNIIHSHDMLWFLRCSPQMQHVNALGPIWKKNCSGM